MYYVLKNKIYTLGEFEIITVRIDDRYEIMNWRNEQIDYLRQEHKLTAEDQDEYFNNTLIKSFKSKRPNQIIFSFLEKQKLIGYGGLVHIDWNNKNAEVSFLLKTKLNSPKTYSEKFEVFLSLIEKVSKDLKLHKIYTFGYDIKKYRFLPLEEMSYLNEAILKDQKMFRGKMVNVKIYSKIL